MNELAEVILQLALLYPHKRRRYVRLTDKHPQLLKRLRDVMGDEWWDDLTVGGALGGMMEMLESCAD